MNLKSIKLALEENNSKILFKINSSNYYYDNFFDCIIKIDKSEIKIIKYSGWNITSDIYLIDQLIRNVKLKKLKKLNIFN